MQSVRTIAVSKPLIEGLANAGDLIAYTARVSNPANQMNTETAPKLIAYLAKHQHWSPFEMAHMTMEIVTTRDIARQILRHRSFAFQEFSQRYAVVDAGKAICRETRLQHPTNRQASVVNYNEDIEEWFQDTQAYVTHMTAELYRQALEHGIAKEQARALLPEGLTESTLYMAGSVRSWVHYVLLRRHVATQKEHREIALMAQTELLKHFPDLQHLLEERDA